ncbi:recombinase family protein [Paenibacillus jamilae]|uniref:recombinase family protein n=1 Tax=Paenibacillus jamilae TaxID=114136 RepID=UPI003D2AEE59
MQNVRAKKRKTKKARAYVRVSTLQVSQKDSPEHQEGLIREEASHEEIEIEHVYQDRGTATNITGREDVKQMIEDAKSGEFHTIYFASLSRFSRDTLDALSLKRTLVNALGIRLVSIEDLYDSAKEDNEMIFGIISSVNQKQSENTSTSVRRGKRQAAKRKEFTGAFAPFGYKKVKIDGRKTLEIVPDKAKVVRLIYDLYVNQGMGEKMIVTFLNEETEIKSPKGGAWGLTTVQKILQNEHYTGCVVFSKFETVQVYEDLDNLQNRRKKMQLRPEDEWEKTDCDAHPAIISTEMFEKAQSIRELNGGGKRGGRRTFVNAFAKLVFCKHCGGAMVAMSSISTSNGKRYTYLMCSKRRRQGKTGCTNKTWIPYKSFRDEVIKSVVNRLKRAVELEGVERSIHDNTVFTANTYSEEIKSIEKLVNANRKLLFEVRRQHMLGQVTDEQYDFEREMYEDEISASMKKIASLSKKELAHKNQDKLRTEVSQALNQLTALNDYDSVDQTRNILMRLIDRINVSEDGDVDIHSVLGKV